MIFKRDFLNKICLVDKYMTDLVSKGKERGSADINIIRELNKYLIENFYTDKENTKFYRSLVQCKIFSYVRVAILNKAKAFMLGEEEQLEKNNPQFVEMCNVLNIQCALQLKEYRAF